VAQKMEPRDMKAKPRVLAVVPGKRDDPQSMIFVRNQVRSLAPHTALQDYYIESRLNPVGLLKGWRDIRKLIKQHRPDVVHAHFGTVTAFLCALNAGVPLVITYRGSDLNPDGSVSRLRKLLSTFMSQFAGLRANHIICVSRELKCRLWWRRCSTSVIPSGVDLRCFAPIDRAEARQKLGWPLHVPILLFAGRVHAVGKRFTLAQEAYAHARSQLPELQLKVVGGETRHEDMPIYFNAADCMIFSSKHEGSPNVIKEALACNLPIVSVDVGDVPERLEGVYPSWIVPDDAGKLGEKIVETIRLGIRSNGRESAARVSEEKVAQDILACYRSANPRLGCPDAADNPYPKMKNLKRVESQII
jgi:teichuronic acid biosynthesis glycosyltransferase TuaC